MSHHADEKRSSSSISSDAAYDATPKLDSATKLEIDAEADAHLGVRTVEAAEQVYGRYSKWFLFVGIGLASYIYSLDGQTTYSYLAFATSSFDKHSLISTIQVAQSIIIACGKPVIAKVADVSSRGTSYIVVLVFYVIGYIVIASANSVGALAAGIILYAIGYTGLQLLTQIIVADITTLKWRGLVSALTSAPFIINAFIGSNVSTGVLEHSTWRWGYGMFAILVPASLSPLVVTLFWAENKARKLGLVKGADVKPEAKGSFAGRAWHVAQQLDIVGLLLLGTAVALILLPLTLAQSAKGMWHNPSMIAMIVVGCILLPVFALWDIYFATRPVIARRFLTNWSVVLASWIGFFDFFSFYLTFTYLYSFVLVTKDWTLINATYFSQTQTVGLTVFGIMSGFFLTWFRRYKWVLVTGLVIRLVGVGLMIHSRGADSSDAEIVWTQILQGIGGGFAAVCSQVGAQASVPHVDVAMVTAVVLLWTEIGGSVGSAVAGAIWTNTMPDKLAAHLPTLSETEIATLFGSITSVMALPFDDPVRVGVIGAYGDTMRVMLIAATVLAVVPLLIALGMPNWYLGDNQNAVDGNSGPEVKEVKTERGAAAPVASEPSRV
ncbi:Siderophore iron transporter 3 [Trametes pubescens]|uniref:Siderophore iron transporter 3 n=1 Tax=Trametes pubescens TaxID=154538 RepID=A0A1M2V3X4_TRAPU|nr:Siderophore iron transporter 3 [Trametes pubescens]